MTSESSWLAQTWQTLRHRKRGPTRPAHKSHKLRAAVAEVLEGRVLLAFDASVSALPSGTSGTGYVLNLSTTGGTASKWVVNFGNGTTSSYLAATYPGGTFPTPFSPTYAYPLPGTYPITATATKSGSSTTAVASFALSSNFGTYDFQQSGTTVKTPSGSTGNSSGQAAVSDGTDLYVASRYNGNRMAITAFKDPSSSGVGGVVDTSFNPNSSTPGTLVLPAFGTGTETDVPYAVTMYGSDIVVVGTVTTSGGSSWGVVDYTTSATQVFKDYGSGAGLPSGQAKAVVAYGSDVFVAGTDGTHMVVAAIDESSGSLDTSFNTTGVKTITIASGANSGANSIIASNDISNNLIVGGYTTTPGCCNSNGVQRSDFTIVRLNTDGTFDTSFGSSGVVTTNFGNVLSSGCVTGVCNAPSADSVYSLVQVNNSDIVAVGSTDAMAATGNNVALAEYVPGTGALVTSFGSFGTHNAGLTVGPAGDGYSAQLDQSNTNTYTVVVGGDNGSGDFQMAAFKTYGSGAGTLDSSYFNSGVATTDFGTASANSSDVCYSLSYVSDSLTGQSEFVAAGSTQLGAGSGQIALADYLDGNEVVIS